MKSLPCIFACLFAINALSAQDLLSRDKALHQLYHEYDAAKKTAPWVCGLDRDHPNAENGWPCDRDYATVSIAVLLMAEVQEDGTDKVYLVASARPANPPNGFECHACRPAIGVAVFKWQGESWILQCANPATGFYGAWGDPPGVDLVKVGPEKHGLLLSERDLAQGFAWSSAMLLLPISGKVTESWRIQDEQDNLGAYDPTDKLNKQVPYRSSAAFKFIAADHLDGSADYYDIEVESRGEDRKDLDHAVKQENWTETYRFTGGKYRLIRHTDFIETTRLKAR